MANWDVLSQEVREELLEKFHGSIEFVEESGLAVLYVQPDRFFEVMTALKNDYGIDYLLDVTAVDEPEQFTVVYQFKSIANKRSLTVKAKLEKAKPEISSVIDLWAAADFLEREVYDLMGIKFLGHPNLVRILLPDDFEGHPLRKDYKLKGRK